METIYFYFMRSFDDGIRFMSFCISMALILCLILYWRYIRKKLKTLVELTINEQKLIDKLISTYLGISVVVNLIDAPYVLQTTFIAPILLGLGALPVVVGLIIYSKWTNLNNNNNSQKIPTYGIIDEIEIDRFEKSIIDKLTNKNEKKFISHSYIKDNTKQKYILKNSIKKTSKEKIFTILETVGYISKENVLNEIEIDQFENDIINKISDGYDKNFILASYTKNNDKQKYILNASVNNEEKDKIAAILEPGKYISKIFGKEGANILRNYVVKILDSEHFLTALRDTLPKGTEDARYGLDFIPFILQQLSERRKRFEKAAKTFFFWTIIMGVLFIGVIITMGYILLDEQSVGSPKTLVEIKNATEKISNDLNGMIKPFTQDNIYILICKVNIDEILNFRIIEGNNASIIKTLQKNISTAQQNNDITFVATSLSDALTNIDNNDKNASNITDLINRVYYSIIRFMNIREKTATNIPVTINNLNLLIEKAKTIVEQPQNRTAEILKRLILSLVIASFLLVILRFLSGLYKNNYNQMLIAEIDDFEIRKFYIAYKGSSENSEERKIAIKSLIPHSAHKKNIFYIIFFKKYLDFILIQ